MRAPRVSRWKWLAVVALGVAAIVSNVYLTDRDYARSLPGMRRIPLTLKPSQRGSR
ncbi:MAG TPA: hypothetical protein VEV82_04690 [Actinomycetota bacterium]|nr:hypothetical protein [Actinomycetota bacterium]